MLFDLFYPEFKNFRSAIETLLNSIPDRFSSFQSPNSALGSVVVAGLAALVSSTPHEPKVGTDSVRLGGADTLLYFKAYCQPLVMVPCLPSNLPP